MSITRPDGGSRLHPTHRDRLDMSDARTTKKPSALAICVVSDYLVAAPTIAHDRSRLSGASDRSDVNAWRWPSVDLHWVGSLMPRSNAAGRHVLLIDARARVLAGDRESAAWIGKSVRERACSANSAIARGNSSNGRIDGVRPHTRLRSVPLSDAPARESGLRGRSAAPHRPRAAALYLAVGFFGILGADVAWVRRRAADRRGSLACSYRHRLGRGDLTHAEGAHLAKEFEPLAAALNDMAQRLAEARGGAALRNERLVAARFDHHPLGLAIAAAR